MESKAAIRKKILAVRDAMEPEVRFSADEAIRKAVMSLIRDEAVDTVLTYVSFRSEADTYGIMEECKSCGVRIAVPRVEKPYIRFCYIDSLDSLKEGYMGIREPDDNCRLWEMHENGTDGSGRTLVLVPGSVFDAVCGRVGYGGGYYDRFLSDNPQLLSAGIAYTCQIVDEVPSEPYDVSLNMVITETQIYRGHKEHV